MTSRVWGIETEYGITCASTQGARPPLDAEHAARELFAPVLKRYGSTNVFLNNGARLYLDVGAHPEYATAECSTLAQVLAQDRAGDAILADLVNQANRRFVDAGVPGQLHLFRNNVDAQGNSCGCHENYMLHRDRHFRELADSLVTFFVARQPLVGAGLVTAAGYQMSQRAPLMDEAVSAATTRSRPLINTRDEPLASAGEYRRLHVICADSNVAASSTLLKIGSGQRVIAALEAGLDLDDLALVDPLAALRGFCADTTGAATARTRGRGELSAAQIMTEILRRLDGFAAPADPLWPRVEDLWRRAISAFARSDWRSVETELDFAIKARLLRQAGERAGRDLDFVTRRRLELAYHDVAVGLRPALEGAGLMVTVLDEDDLAAARTRPPATTRAHVRGSLLAAGRAAHLDVTADWLHVTCRGRTLTLPEPLATTTPEAAALLDELRGNA